MPPTLTYQHVTVLIGIADPLVLQAVRGTLYHLGVRDMTYMGTARELRDAVVQRTPDLLICATELDPDLPRLITQVRHGDVGTNPFVPVVLVTTHATEDLVQAVVNCGADDLLPYPWSTGYLDQRLEKLIAERRPFVVTSDYVGPDRRAQPRAGQSLVDPMVVPNPLRAKALERRSSDALAAEIQAAAAALNADKIRRLAELTVRLINELAARLDDGEGLSPLTEACLDKLIAAAQAIVRRAPNTTYAPGAATCRAIIDTATKARDGMVSGTVPDLKAMRPLVSRFVQLFQIPPELAKAGLPDHLRDRLPQLKLRQDFL